MGTAGHPYTACAMVILRLRFIASAERHGLDPQAYLTGVLAQIATTPITQLDQFLPDVWKKNQAAETGRKA